MSVIPLLREQAFDPEVIHAMGVAYQKICEQLRLSDTSDAATELVATKIIHFARMGERDPERLCRAVLDQLKTES
jgi:hypothetical protein